MPRPRSAADPARLRRAALRHLERYPTSRSRLREVLLRAVARWLRRDPPDDVEGVRERAVRHIDALLDDLAGAGLLDDEALARAWVDTLARRGVSAALQRRRLREKGLPDDVARAAIDGSTEAERQAAWALARRRRLGPFRTNPLERRERRRKDLAAMARGGFPPSLCREVVDAEVALER